ncbi:MAG: oligosaccharide flippase family protein [Planctomycetes bacterium]|jgi:O-antigen/teichoic acid export membrane protein|nr:oligosaccharide flippase family protein [Planctomycetota bacterium]
MVLSTPVTGAEGEAVAGSAPGLRQAAVRGTLLTMLSVGVGQGLRFVSSVLLTRLLFEEAFMVMGMVNATVQGLAMFSDVGFGLRIVQSPRGDDRDLLDTVWTLQVIRGVLLAVFAAALGWPLAMLYAHQPLAAELVWLLPVVGLGPLIDGFQSTKPRTAMRHMHMRIVTIVEIVVQVLGITAMLLLAWWLRSLLALAIGGVIQAAIGCLLSHVAYPGQGNRFRWHRESVREVMTFGSWILLSTAVCFLALQVDKYAMPGLFQGDVAGVYVIAANLAVLAPMVMGRIQSSISFPLYARVLDRRLSLEEAVERAKPPVLVLGGFAIAMLLAAGGSLVLWAYDSRYWSAAAMLPWLAIGAWFSIMEGNYGAAFLAIGRSRYIAIVQIVKVATYCALLWPLSAAYGMHGAVLAMAASDLMKFAATAVLASRTISWRVLGSDLRLSAFVGAVALVVTLVGDRLAAWSEWPSLVDLLVRAAMVGLLFLPLLLRTLRQVRGRSA